MSFRIPLAISTKHNLFNSFNNTNIKYYKSLLNVTNCKCNFINKYGVNCENKCLKETPFELRKIFCEYHIKNYIHFIIKLNVYIYNFLNLENNINNILIQSFPMNKLQTEKLMIKNLMNKLYLNILNNEEYVLITQPIINRINNHYFECFTIGIFDFNEYKMKLNLLNMYRYDKIISRNKKNKKQIIELLKQLSTEQNNVIGKVFKNTKIGDVNIFKIIENYF